MNKHKEPTAEVEVLSVIEHYWKPTMSVLLVLMLGWCGYIGFNYYMQKKEKTAQEELFSIQKGLEKKTQELMTPPEAKDQPKKDDVVMREIPKTPEELGKNFAEFLEQYENIVLKNPGRKVSYMAAIQAAGLANAYKDYARAEKMLLLVADKVSSDDVFFGLVHSHLASTEMDLNKFSEAAEELAKVVNNKVQSYFHAHALLRMSVCYMQLKEWDKAESVLVRIEKDFPMTQAAMDAKNYKKLLVIKKGAKS